MMSLGRQVRFSTPVATFVELLGAVPVAEPAIAPGGQV
jgi:hypothetical protein